MREQDVLRRLTKGGYISGEQLSHEMGITRAAVWKCVETLRRLGYEVDAVRRVGYRLIPPKDAIWEACVREGLHTKWAGCEMEYYDELDSTNTRAKAWAGEGAPHGALVLANHQTMGRGRMSRHWSSEPGKSIAMTMIIRPNISVNYMPSLTLAVALATAEALDAFADGKVLIKWPNDLVFNGRKLCGILNEVSGGIDGIEWAILGIGVNAQQSIDDFPADLRQIAISLREITGHDVNRAEIVRAILTHMESRIEQWLTGGLRAMRDSYVERSATLGHEVRVITPTGEYNAVADSLTSDGALIVICNDGELRTVTAGDVSVRGLMGYT